MLNNLLEIIKSILNFFFNKKKEEKLEIINKIEEKQQEVDFKSTIEDIAKKAESKILDEKQKAIDDMRNLIAE